MDPELETIDYLEPTCTMPSPVEYTTKKHNGKGIHYCKIVYATGVHMDKSKTQHMSLSSGLVSSVLLVKTAVRSFACITIMHAQVASLSLSLARDLVYG